MKKGELVNVDGYFWSERLWEDADGHVLRLPTEVESRAWRVVDFKGAARTELEAWARGTGRLRAANVSGKRARRLFPRRAR